ncbi:MAG TPA: polysaccharide deacetylase family sporulation protein PdaB [Negativicutes bacterium]|nr:polysaccharide deacetylase family sporulation protein PdaB [Negativicutes bacterium]
MRVFGFVEISPRAKLSIIIVLALVFLTSGMYYVQAYHRLKPVTSVQTDKKLLALTFDISWGNKMPGPVMDILAKEKVKATFFISGPWCKQYPELAQRLKSDGHEIGSHGYRHINLSTLSPLEIKEELNKASANIKEVTEVEPRLLRTPNGDYNDAVITTARQNQYEVIQWSVDSLDWMNPGVANISERVLKKAHPGAIVLLHASDTCQQTDKALPIIIKKLKEEGYQLVTVSELFKAGTKVE